MTKTIKAEYLPGGAKRQEMLDQVPGLLAEVLVLIKAN
jgi:hypothetical protein